LLRFLARVRAFRRREERRENHEKSQS
jgi:hypothetical protein